MIHILQKPDSLSLVGNMKKLIVKSYNRQNSTDVPGNDVTLALTDDLGSQLLVRTFSPDSNCQVEVDLRDVITAQLAFNFSNADTPYRQADIVKSFYLSITDGSTTNTSELFTVIRAGVDRLADTAANFLEQNFLTWQPTVKGVTYWTPEFLTYYAQETVSIKCQPYAADGSAAATTITLATISGGEAWTVPVQYAIIAGLAGMLPSYYDVWVENQNGQRLTYIQRYYAQDMRSEQEEWVLFENSLGGIDTFRAYGDSDNQAEHAHNIAEIDEEKQEYRVDTERKFKKHTGRLDRYERRWLLDFFPSLAKYIYVGDFLRQIVVTDSDVNYKASELPSSYTFTYQYADARPYLNLPRTDTPQEVLTISIPDLASFTVAPRLVELPRLQLSDGALFPVQDPYSEGWATTTFGTILATIRALLNGDINTAIALFMNNEYLSKLKDDTAQGEIGFLKGLWIKAKGLFGFDEDGNIKANDIDVAGNAGIEGALTVEGKSTFKGLLDALTARINTIGSDNYHGSGLGDTGWMVTNDHQGHSYMEVDELLVRMRATFMELEIRKESYLGGNIVYSPAGSVLYRVDCYDASDNLLGYDEILVPWTIKDNPLMAFFFGKKNGHDSVYGSWRKVSRKLTAEDYANTVKFRCYMISDDGTSKTRNWWKLYDQARCQTYNKAGSKEATTQSDAVDPDFDGSLVQQNMDGNKFYWRLVIGVGTAMLEDGNLYDYIDLSNTGVGNGYMAGSDYPQAGDSIVCMGNRSVPERMGMVMIETIGDDAPAIKTYDGINSFSLEGRRKTIFSPRISEVVASEFRMIQVNGTKTPLVVERQTWEKGQRYHYYDRVTWDGSLWLCIISDGYHWESASGTEYAASRVTSVNIVNGSFTYSKIIDDKVYTGRAYYTRTGKIGSTTVYYVRNFTYLEPTTDNDSTWERQVKKGVTITGTETAYAISSSGSTPPSSGWKTSIAATGVADGDYLWTRVTTRYSDNIASNVAYSVQRYGLSVKSSVPYYAYTAQVLTMPTDDERVTWKGSYNDIASQVSGSGYIWVKTVITYSDGKTLSQYSVTRVGDSVASVEEWYAVGTSRTTAPTGYGTSPVSPWQKGTAPAYDGDQQKIYLWNFELTIFSNGNKVASDPHCIGNLAKGIKTLTEYYALSAYGTVSGSQLFPDDITSWSTSNVNMAPNDTYPYQWNKTVTSYNDGSADDVFYHVSAVKGTRGTAGYGYQTIYRVLDEGVTATKPTSTAYPPAGWSINPPTRGEDQVLWMCQRSILGDGTGASAWSDPVRLSGDNGDIGADGTDIEFIYKQSNSLPTANDKPTNNTTTDDYVPTDEGWTDNPSGVDSSHKFEWMCQRIKPSGQATWNDWVGPFVWSAYGDKGTDGDGYEYAFFLTKGESYKPTVVTAGASGTVTDAEYLPGQGQGGANYNGTRWTDDPTGVSETWPVEWVVARRKINGTWQDFGEPAVWATYSDPSVSYKLVPSPSSMPFRFNSSNVLIPSSYTLKCKAMKMRGSEVYDYFDEDKYYKYYAIVDDSGNRGSWTKWEDNSLGRKVDYSKEYTLSQFASWATASGTTWALNSGISDISVGDKVMIPCIYSDVKLDGEKVTLIVIAEVTAVNSSTGVITTKNSGIFTTNIPKNATKASVDRNGSFTDSDWVVYAAINHTETWGNTSSTRGDCKTGDFFIVTGTSTNGNYHTAIFRCTNDSGNLQGICVSHRIVTEKSLTIPSSTEYTAVEFCLSSAESASLVADTNIIDSSRVAVTKDGTNITMTEHWVKYAVTDSNTKPDDTSFTYTAYPTGVANGRYIWTWTHEKYSNGVANDAYSVSRAGIDGKGVKSTEVKYCQKETTSVKPENFAESDWGDYPTNLNQHWWLYTRTKTIYSDDTQVFSYASSQIGTGSHYAGVVEYYALSDSDSTVPNPPTPGTYAAGADIEFGTNWQQGSRPAQDYTKPYLWNFEISSDSQGNHYVTQAICIGNWAKGIVAIIELYAISQYSAPQSGRDFPNDITSWTDEHQDAAPTNAKPYQWNKTIVAYNSSTHDSSDDTWLDSTCDIHYHVSAVKGDAGSSIRTVSIYKWSATSPDKPTSTSIPPSGWLTADSGTHAATDLLWMCWGTAVNGVLDTSGWSGPVRMSGKDGDAGADGELYEYIYKQANTLNGYGTHPKNITTKASSSAGNSKADDDFVPDGWTDNPQGVSTSMKYELCSIREKKNGTWGDFSDPFPWAVYGDKGQDGDGVQYVFKHFDHELTDAERISNTPTRNGITQNANGEWIPTGWSDDPVGTTPEMRYEYVATIKRTNNVWGDFETITLWSKYALDGGTLEMRYQWNQSATSAPTFTANAQNPGSAWQVNVPNRPDGYYLWVISAIKNANGTYGTWGNAVRLTGDTGTPGEDGDEREWIYNYANTGYDGSTGQKSPTGAAGSVTSNKNQEDWVPAGWYDTALAVSKDNPTVYASWRDITNNGTTKTYGAFHEPIVWSHFGRNGMDGDGIEYVFARTTTNTPPNITNNDSYTDGGTTMTVSSDEFRPMSSVGRCSDDPQGVDSINKFEWFAVRTKGAADANGNRTWNGFTLGAMKLWAKWSSDGSFKSTAFIRTNQDISNVTPTGGNYGSPVPTSTNGGATWHDGIPSGSANLWSSYCTFYGDGSSSGWSNPVRVMDTEGYDVEFSPNESQPSEPYDIPFANRGNGTRYGTLGTDSRANGSGLEADWYDPVLDADNPHVDWEDMIWRAEHKIENNAYIGEWVMTRIKGEKGEPGDSPIVFSVQPANFFVPLDPEDGSADTPVTCTPSFAISTNNATGTVSAVSMVAKNGITFNNGTLQINAPYPEIFAGEVVFNITGTIAGRSASGQTVMQIVAVDGGAQGLNGVSATLTPPALIFNQIYDEGSANNGKIDITSDNNYTQIVVMDGNSNVTASIRDSIQVSSGQCTAAVDGTKVRITAISTRQVTVDGATVYKYYDEGHVTITFNYGGRQFNLTLNFAVNLFGDFDSYIKDGVRKALAEAKVYDKDANGNIVSTTYLFDSLESAIERMFRMSRQSTGSNRIPNVETGSGWVDSNNSAVQPTVDSEGNVTYDDDVLSPTFFLPAGIYVCSFEVTQADAESKYVDIMASETDGTNYQIYNGDYVPYDGGNNAYSLKDGRYYFVFTLPSDSYCVFEYMGTDYVRNPQVEPGAVPTLFNIGRTDSDSYIKQTADEIQLQVNGKASTGYVDTKAEQVRLGITQGLTNTGINITSGTVAVEADKFTVSNDGMQVFGVDSTTGQTTMQDVVIKGTLMYKRIFAKEVSTDSQLIQVIHCWDSEKGLLAYDDIVLYGEYRSDRHVDIYLPPASTCVGATFEVHNHTTDYTNMEQKPTDILIHVEDDIDDGPTYVTYGTDITYCTNRFVKPMIYEDTLRASVTLTMSQHTILKLVAVECPKWGPQQTTATYVWMLLEATRKPGVSVNGLRTDTDPTLTFVNGVLTDYR